MSSSPAPSDRHAHVAATPSALFDDADRGAPTNDRERVYMVKRTLVERCFYDPDKIRREFGAPEAGESFEDFVVRVFERLDGSIYGDEFFPGDASPEVYTELEERWEDE